MEPVLLFVESLFILIPIMIGIIRFKAVRNGYFLFYLDVWCGFLTEIVSYILIRHHSSNAIPTNIFVLSEWTLLAFQFRQWGFMRKRERLFYFFFAIPVLVWVTENLIFRKILEFSPYFRILYSFLLVILSVTEVNFVITHTNKNLFRNSKFIICVAFILYFIYQIVYEWAYQLSVLGKAGFTLSISSLFSYINALTNIVLGIALLILPAERKFRLE